MGFKGQLKGVVNFSNRLAKTIDNTRIQSAKALNAEGKIELKEMQRRTPVETGELVDSSDMTEATPKDLSVSFHYDAEHAVVVHEDLDAFHQVGQAKYMESVLNESSPHIVKRVAKRIDMERAAKG